MEEFSKSVGVTIREYSWKILLRVSDRISAFVRHSECNVRKKPPFQKSYVSLTFEFCPEFPWKTYIQAKLSFL